jgi:hypothetical protein
MQTLILIAHSIPSLSGSSRDGVNSLHSFLSVPFSLSYSFTLTPSTLLGRRLLLHRLAALFPHQILFFSRP